jgi:O-antigen ligase
MRNLREKLYSLPFGKDMVDIFLVTLLLLCLLKPEENNGNDGNESQSLVPSRPILLYVILTYTYLWLGSLQLGIDLPIGLGDERFSNWKNHMVLPVLFFITLRVVREKRQIILFSSFIFISIFLVGFHFYRTFGHTGGSFRWDRRESGVFSYLGPNELGAFFAEYSFIVLGILFLYEVKRWKWPLWALLSLSIYCVIYSFSRGAYLAFLAAFLFISLASKNIKALVLLVFFLISWNTLVPQSVVERIEMTRSEEGEFESSAAGRLGRAEHGINLFLRNPLGYGFETVRFLGFYNNRGQISSHGDPHNRYVEYLVEMGILGIGIFLYLFYRAFKSGWILYIKARDGFLKGLGLGFAAAVIACMVANLFGDRWTYEILSGFYWVFWALVVRGNIITHMDQNVSNSFPNDLIGKSNLMGKNLMTNS